MRRIRGLDKTQEQDPRLLIRDTRTLGMRIADFFKSSLNASVVVFMCAVAGFMEPGIIDLLMVFALIVFTYAVTRKETLPFRLPASSNMKDYNNPMPGSNKPKKAGGIAYFGNDIASGNELWFTNEDMRTHVLIFGSTGSGKTEALVSLAYNALIQSSGFIYVDGKGDNSLFAKIFSMTRKMGREDDVLLVNFMTGARDIIGPQEKRLSNTLNPFARGSSSVLSQLVVSMMDSASASPDGDMWKGRAIAFVEALMRVMVYARDQDYLLLDANTIRNYFLLERIIAMDIDKVLVRDGQESVSLANAPSVVLEGIKNYLDNLPGYNRSKKDKQVSQVLEQHGFVTMQLVRVFTSLADTYGHILRTNLAEVDLHDVVLNRRILVVLLPALEKSPAELSNLGKVIVATLKAMMASGLGEQVEGDYRDVILRKPTNAPTPYICILDEYGYYAVEGFAVVPAQARSLGFSTIFAGQDLPAFQKTSKEEAASIGANTNIKIAMKLEDPTETWEFFSKTAGEAFVTKVDAFQTDAQSFTNTYMDTRSSSAEKRARIDLLDLKDQREGEAHIFFKSDIVRARMFYADPKPVKELRMNHFLRVEPPKDAVLREYDNRQDVFEQALSRGFKVPPLAASGDNEEVDFLVQSFKTNNSANPIERGVSALMAYQERSIPQIEETHEELPENELNIFTDMRVRDNQKFLVSDKDRFTTALLNRGVMRSNIEGVERYAGKSAQHAVNIAEEIVKDMQYATHYPPRTDYAISPVLLSNIIEDLSGAIQRKIDDNASTSEGLADL